MGKKAVAGILGVSGIAIAAFIIFAFVSPSVQKSAGTEQTSTAPDVVSAESQTAVTDVYESVPVNTVVPLLSDTYIIQPDSKTVVTFTAASSEKAYLVGTAFVKGGDNVWLEVRDINGECAFFCENKLIWDRASGGLGASNPDNNNVRLNVFTGVEQQLIIYTQSSRAQTITFDLSLSYEGTQTQNKSSEQLKEPIETFTIPG